MKRCLVVATLLLAAVRLAPAEPTSSFKVIVNSAVPGRKVPRDVLAQIYLGRARKWGDGRPIAAVDLSSTSSVRRAFSSRILEMPVILVQQHWLRAMSAGKVPPRTKETDEDVIAFVAADPGGVGYVSDAATIPPSVRVIAVE